MSGKIGVGATNIMKIAVGSTELRKIAVGTVEVWSGIEELTEEWSTIDSAIWSLVRDPGSGQNLYADGALRAPGVDGWNQQNYAYAISKKQYRTPYGRWAVRMGTNSNSGLPTFITLSSDAQGSEGIAVRMTSNKCELTYRTSASNSPTTWTSGNYGYNTQSWVIVERLENSTYRISFDNGATWPISYRDANRLGERAHMGHVGAGICSDINLFYQRGYGGAVDRFKYTNDPAANITA